MAVSFIQFFIIVTSLGMILFVPITVLVKINKRPNKSLHPWRRLLARYVDTFVVGAVVVISLEKFMIDLFPKWIGYYNNSGIEINTLIVPIIYALICLIINSFSLSKFGTTLGKKIFGIKVRATSGNKIDIKMAIKREWSVYTNGMCLGIPILSWITIWLSLNDLQKHGNSKWDRALGLELIHSKPYYKKSYDDFN